MRKESKTRQNFFSKIYGSLEKSYFNFSEWLTKKGIPLNNLNRDLDKKGIPAFALMGSIFLIIILLVLFLFVFNISSSTQVTFKLQDSYDMSIDNTTITIKDAKGKTTFSELVLNNQIQKIKLKVGDTYIIKAIKEGYPDYSEEKVILSKDQVIRIIFQEEYEEGNLKLKIIDKDNQKIIPLATATVNYKLNGEEVQETANTDQLDNYNITLELPKEKEIELIITADKYQDFKQEIQLNEDQEEKTIELVVSDGLFEGKSKVTFIVTTKSGEMIDNAVVEVYNFAQELIASQTTVDGKALVPINTGETILFTVNADGYRTHYSNEETSYRILTLEKTIPVSLEIGGTQLDVKVIDTSDFITLDNTEVLLYDLSGNLIDSNYTLLDGKVNFKGLETDAELIVSACKENYFCAHELVSLKEKNSVELKLEKITIDNSSILDVFVVDGQNLPVDTAKIRLFEVKDTLEIPYSETTSVDATGGISFPLKVGHQYKVEAYVGDVYDFDYVTISDISENKIIFVIDAASRIYNLELLNLDGSTISDGSLLIKTKDNTVLYIGDINGSATLFGSEGYSDFIIEYTDVNGNVTTGTLSGLEADPNGLLSFTIRPKTVGNYPIIEFVGVQDGFGQRTSFVTKDKEYYLVFDIIFPEGTINGGVHVRAGDDSETDSEDMSYGITGFKADTSNFKYSTTYSPVPEPGAQSIDVLNEGSAGVLNKWLELKWRNGNELGTKQIKVKVKATDSSVFKLNFKYRAWVDITGKIYREPKDTTLNEKYSNSQKQSLYAETKEIFVELFDAPANCNDEFCVSYQFIDSQGISYSREDFYALKDDIYALEATLFSYKNKEVNLEVDTSTTQPIISFVSVEDNLSFPTNVNYQTVSQLELTKEHINLQAGYRKKVYVFFVAKNIGTSYANLKLKASETEQISNKLSFNILEKRNLRVLFNPDLIIPYGSVLNIDVYDSVNGDPIENALITIEDEHGQFITSIKGNQLNGKAGRYNLNINFVVNKLKVTVSGYGYVPYTRELLVADNSVLLGPSEVLINMGTDQTSGTTTFNLQNVGSTTVTDVHVGEPIWIEEADELLLDVRGPITILKNSNVNFQITASATNNSQFKSAIAKVPIYGLVGNRQVARLIPVRVVRGLVVDDCLVIQPKKIDTYVGLNLDYQPNNYYNSSFTDYSYNYGNNPFNSSGSYSNTNSYGQNNYSYNTTPFLSNNSYNNSTNYNSYDNYFNDNYSYNTGYNNYNQSNYGSNNTGYNNYNQSNYGSNNTGYNNYNQSNYRSYNDGTNNYYSSHYKTTAGDSENTIAFTIQNKCDKTVVLNPQLVPIKSNSNNELEIELTEIIVMPGEEKLYDLTIKNTSERKQPKTYNYDILWDNTYYSLPPSELNVKLLDLSKALWVTPQVIYVPISQLEAQEPGITGNRFMIKNIGNVPITNIQVSHYPQIKSANIGVMEYPREIDILEPGQSIPIDLKFMVNIKQSTLDDMYFTVTGKAAGVNNPITANVTTVFVISSPNCLKVSPKKVNYDLKIGEKRARNISITNQCAEPVTIQGIDKRNNTYFQTFGNNPVALYPTFGNTVIPVNGNAEFALDISAVTFGGSPSMPLKLIGKLVTSGNYVSSESILVALNIQPEDADDALDDQQTNEAIIPVCGSEDDEIETINYPIISIGDCSGADGYCDAYGVADLILKKINTLSGDILNVASHAQNQVNKTGCSLQKATQGFCPISDVGGSVKPVEFTVYMQNDTVSPELLREVLKKTDYKFKNYLVEVNQFEELPQIGYGVYEAGNKIHLTSGLHGCGRYKIEIDGFVATTYETIYPERAYFYVNLVEAETTEQCSKNIINYLNFLPWDTELTKGKSKGTWLTVFSGDENVANGVIKGISKFKNDTDRYIKNSSLGSKNNHLNISVGLVNENPEALAKVYFNDPRLFETPVPEQINVVINNRFAYGENKDKLPEKVITDATKVISSFINKDEYADICISKDKDYLLILKLIDAGELKFNPAEKFLPIKTKEICTDFNLTSGITETLKITADAPEDLVVTFKENKDSKAVDELVLDVIEKVDINFEVCYSPKPGVPEIYKFVGKEVRVRAHTIYSDSGNIGQRDAEAIIKLISCGVNPLDLLEVTNNKVGAASKTGKAISEYYALIDWNKSYNTGDSEKLCETIKKFIAKNKDAGMFFDYKDAQCDTGKTEAENDAKWNKGISNGITYFASCMAACSACTVASNALISWIPGLGQIALSKGIIFDCGFFACGVPAVTMLLHTGSDGGIAEFIDGIVTKLFPKTDGTKREIFKGLADYLSEGINGIFNTIGASRNFFNNSAMAKTTPLKTGVAEATIPSLGGIGGKSVITPQNGIITTDPAVPGVKAKSGGTVTKYLRVGGALVHDGAGNPVPIGTTTIAAVEGKVAIPAKTQSVKYVSANKYNTILTDITTKEKAINNSIKEIDGKLKAYTPKERTSRIGKLANKTNNLLSPKSKISRLTNEKALLEGELKKVTELKSSLSGAKLQKIDGVVSKVRVISDKAVNNMAILKSQTFKPKVPNPIWGKRLTGGLGFARSIACMSAGNYSGSKTLEASGLTGLDNAVAITEDTVFNKNSIYKVELFDNTNQANQSSRYTMKINKFTGGSIPDDQRVDHCGK